MNHLDAEFRFKLMLWAREHGWRVFEVTRECLKFEEEKIGFKFQEFVMSMSGIDLQKSHHIWRDLERGVTTIYQAPTGKPIEEYELIPVEQIAKTPMPKMLGNHGETV